MSLHQALSYADFRNRLEFRNWISQQPSKIHKKILFSDENTFTSDGSVNIWNCRYWEKILIGDEKLTINMFEKSTFDVELLENIVKAVIYHKRPPTRDNMIRRIRDAIRSLDADKIFHATNNFEKRVLNCIEANGGHFEHHY
ncbi:hypothetical protein ACFW04_014825 [Cataglyphis niger]